jgi:hypothetical protein
MQSELLPPDQQAHSQQQSELHQDCCFLHNLQLKGKNLSFISKFHFQPYSDRGKKLIQGLFQLFST